jgi:hypothetical protein
MTGTHRTAPAAAALAVLSLLAGACGSEMRVHSERNPSVDLDRYATYAWTPSSIRDEGPLTWTAVDAGIDPRERELLDWQIKAAVDAELSRRNYTQAAARPDLLVAWHVITRQKDLDDTLGEYARYRAEGGAEAWGAAWVSGYQEGSLIVELTDARTRQLVWLGSATAVTNPELREKRVPEAVRLMFAQLPARAPEEPAGR